MYQVLSLGDFNMKSKYWQKNIKANYLEKCGERHVNKVWSTFNIYLRKYLWLLIEFSVLTLFVQFDKMDSQKILRIGNKLENSSVGEYFFQKKY